MERVSRLPRLLLIVDYHAAGSETRFGDLFRACVDSLPSSTDIAIQLRIKLPDSKQEAVLIRPLVDYQVHCRPTLSLHINTNAAPINHQLHPHLNRARWQDETTSIPDTFSASLDHPDELRALLRRGRPQFLVVGPLTTPRSKQRPPIALETLRELQTFGIPTIGVGGITASAVENGELPRCDGYAILTPVRDALDAPERWRETLESWSFFLKGDRT